MAKVCASFNETIKFYVYEEICINVFVIALVHLWLHKQ